jgi:hypothetical protein
MMSKEGRNCIIQIQEYMSKHGLVNDEESIGDFYYLSKLLLQSYSGLLSSKDCGEIINISKKYYKAW